MDRRRSLPCEPLLLCSAGKRNGLGQSRHRDLSKAKAEAVEPVLDADRGDMKVANYGGVNVHTGEKVGYVITNAKAKNKAERISISNRNGLVYYDRQDYVAQLKAAAKEVGFICAADSPKNRATSARTVIRSFRF